MKLITELNEKVNYIFEEDEKSGKKNYFIEGVFMQGNLKNRNGRVYPSEVLAKEATRYDKEYIQKNKAYGELGHPQGPTINLERVSHMIKELKPDGSNFVGRAKVLDTPYGNIVKNLIDEGAQLGVSSRGMGTIRERNGAQEVQSDFMLSTAADIVPEYKIFVLTLEPWLIPDKIKSGFSPFNRNKPIFTQSTGVPVQE